MEYSLVTTSKYPLVCTRCCRVVVYIIAKHDLITGIESSHSLCIPYILILNI